MTIAAKPGSIRETATANVTSRWFSEIGWIAGFTALAWVHRAAFLVSNRDRAWPFTIFYQGDSRIFYDYALAILKGVPYDNGIPFHPPGLAYLLALIYQLVGAEPVTGFVPHMTVRLMMASISSLSVGLIFVLVRPYLGGAVALLTALLCLYHFGLYVISVAPLTEGPYLTLLLTVLLVWSRTLEHPLQAPGTTPYRGGRAGLIGFLLGVLSGLLVLIRAEGLLIVMLCTGCGLLGCWQRRKQTTGEGGLKTLLPWICLVVGWLLALTPWTVHNAHNLSMLNQRLAGRLAEPLPTFVPVTLYGPLNLALANHPQADGTFSRDLLTSQVSSGILDLTDPQHLDFVLNGRAMAWRYMREQPDDFLRLLRNKWALGLQAANLGWSQWNLPGGLNGIRRPVDIFVPEHGAGWLIVALTVFGLLMGLRIPGGARRWSVLTWCLTAVVLLTTGLFFGYARQWLMLLPFWLATVAMAIVALSVRMHNLVAGNREQCQAIYYTPIRRTLLIACVVLALVMLVLEGLGSRADRNYKASGTTLPGRSRLNPDLPVRINVLPHQSTR